MSRAALDDVEVLEQADTSLLDLIDHALNKGIVLSGELVLGLADVDLVYVRIAALVCAADRVLPREQLAPVEHKGGEEEP